METLSKSNAIPLMVVTLLISHSLQFKTSLFNRRFLWQSVGCMTASCSTRGGLIGGRVLVDRSLEASERQYYRTFEQELEARVSMIQRIRAGVPDDFLILCNSNWAKLPITGPYINGGFMETFRDGYDVYQNRTLADIEDALLWYEANVREPRINCLRGDGIPTEPPDSPTNRRWMRLFTTMSLTLFRWICIIYDRASMAKITSGIRSGMRISDNLLNPQHGTIKKILRACISESSPTAGRFIIGVGNLKQSHCRTSATPVSDRGSTDASITHLLPDLDGEIYLKVKHPADVNGDWVVNILDLVEVSNSFGKSSPDPNGDGVVNVLDLVFVVRQFSQ